MAVLKATGLQKSYKRRMVVSDVSLEVGTGQIVGLLGPNGAGKTTSFYMIVGLVQRDAGLITIDEQDISLQPMHIRARNGIGYLPQEASIFRRLSVFDNLMGVMQTRKGLSREEREDKVEQLLEEFNITHIRDSLGQSLSGGERRRVEIARALAAEPRFILLDEPFAGVDPISVIDIKKIIQHLKERGLGVLITDHNVRETLDVCEKAYIVSHGKMIAEGAPADILAEKLVDFCAGGGGVLDRIVQQRHRDGRFVEMHFGEDCGNFQRMRDVGVAIGPLLLAVFLHRVNIGLVQQGLIRIRFIFLNPLNEFVLPHHAIFHKKKARQP